MAGEAIIEVIGNLTDDPELRYTQGGTAVCSFSVANPPHQNPSGDWENETTVYYNVTVWGQPGENVANSLRKGQRVIVRGGVHDDSYTNKEGQTVKGIKIVAEVVAPDLRFATANSDSIPRQQRQRPRARFGSGIRAGPAERRLRSPPVLSRHDDRKPYAVDCLGRDRRQPGRRLALAGRSTRPKPSPKPACRELRPPPLNDPLRRTRRPRAPPRRGSAHGLVPGRHPDHHRTRPDVKGTT